MWGARFFFRVYLMLTFILDVIMYCILGRVRKGMENKHVSRDGSRSVS